MTTRTKWLILIFIIISLAAILLPIIFYISDFHELNRSKSPSEWGAFGDYLGGLLNPLIAFLTLIVTIIIAINISKIEQRNHEEYVHSPVKPLITINNADFFSSDVSINGLTVEKDFYSYNPPENPAGPLDYLNNEFFFVIHNKGLGLASNVNFAFEIDLDILENLLSINNPQINVITTYHKTGDHKKDFIIVAINSNRERLNFQGSYKVFKEEQIGCGVIDIDNTKEIPIPSQIMSAFQLHNLIQHINLTNERFPPIKVTVKYRNIHDKLLVSKFYLRLLLIYDYRTYKRFTLIHEQIFE